MPPLPNTNKTISTASGCGSRDQLTYMADLLAELCEMARDQRLVTLAGLLELAHVEACQRAKDFA